MSRTFRYVPHWAKHGEWENKYRRGLHQPSPIFDNAAAWRETWTCKKFWKRYWSKRRRRLGLVKTRRS